MDPDLIWLRESLRRSLVVSLSRAKYSHLNSRTWSCSHHDHQETLDGKEEKSSARDSSSPSGMKERPNNGLELMTIGPVGCLIRPSPLSLLRFPRANFHLSSVSLSGIELLIKWTTLMWRLLLTLSGSVEIPTPLEFPRPAMITLLHPPMRYSYPSRFLLPPL